MVDDVRVKALPPEAQPGASALDYHDIPVDLKSSAAAEPLVELRKYGVAAESYYAREDGLNAPYYRQVCATEPQVRCRKTVAEKLQRVNARLKNYGVELFVYDAYRPVACQKALWTYFLNEAKRQLKTDNAEQLRKFAGKFCSNPSAFDIRNSHTWPTHVTGGAVDLTLRRMGSGELLYMGTVFDEASGASYTNAFETDENDSASVLEARRNRRLLYWAMRGEGFSNYPYEWWHYDYGTQMWVQNSRRLPHAPTTAIYGPAS
jgi:D-alanyl-D-alanine dipeptidase